MAILEPLATLLLAAKDQGDALTIVRGVRERHNRFQAWGLVRSRS
jgi:hypothetical protein